MSIIILDVSFIILDVSVLIILDESDIILDESEFIDDVESEEVVELEEPPPHAANRTVEHAITNNFFILLNLDFIIYFRFILIFKKGNLRFKKIF